MISVRNALGTALLAAVVLWSEPLAAQCAGDCDGSGVVTVDEVLAGVNIALGNAPLGTCPAFDANGDQRVTVDEILAAVANALNGCPIAATPTATATVVRLTPTPPPGCGNGVVDFNLGETCDDGNTIDDDGATAINPCPANCRIAACTSTANTVTADVSFTAPSGVDIAGLTIFLRYPDGVVQIPGHASDDQVQSSILNLPGNAFATPNDLDFALRLVMVSTDQTPFPPGLVFSVQFGTCQGAPPPTADDFTCVVEDAADTSLETVSGVTCTVVLGGNTPLQPSQQPQPGIFALRSEPLGNGETQVALHSLSTAGTIITVVSQIDYDTKRLSMRGCEIGQSIGAGTAAGKTLHFAEPTPGIVRAVIEGGLQALPPMADVLTCTFATAPGTPPGPVMLQAHGNVADMSFVDRGFAAEATVDARK